ncbi:uncharacterized protein PIG-Wa [Halyomorpha halys]|uniref:uncharacterized protein PIG-Wa n=1 Tax=Halyomorpha halys TaxID=286706 RepID=UPI0006D50673|nr:GPI-anchored wall transfer protein 1 [Halyomorpha halys]
MFHLLHKTIMTSTKSYRELHEEFVHTNTGGTPWECLLLVIPYPLLAFICCYCVNFVFKLQSGFILFFTEFSLLVVPLILSLTLCHSYIHIFVSALLLSVILCLICNLWNQKKNFIRIAFTLVTSVKSRPYITYFRSIVNLISVFCILAVDFRVFPRHFAKTESYGFSLMDTGVGFYIIANGIVSKSDTREDVMKTIKSTLPIMGLGIFRCVSVKSLDYQQVISEYGTHWNFFFTLAAVKLMATYLMNKFQNKEMLTSIVLAILHQIILQAGVESWMISDAPRNNPLSANREGICSLLGYLSLFLGAMAIGKSLQRDSVDLYQDLKHASKGFLISVFLFLATFWLHSRYPVSRRFVNVTYIFWMISMTFLLLSVCILIEMCLRIIYFIKSKTTNDHLAPSVLNSINYNGLIFFLMGNIFTGVVNIWIQTLHVENRNSIVILTVYMFILCFFANIFYRNRIKFSL